MDPNEDVTRQGVRAFELGPVPTSLVLGLVILGGVQSWVRGSAFSVLLSAVIGIALVVKEFVRSRPASEEKRVRIFGAVATLFGLGLCALGLRAILQSSHEVPAPIVIIVAGAVAMALGLIMMARPSVPRERMKESNGQKID